ncbi:hypothetical protein PAAG_05111 [Paracoccidioides lutzii Pb01]|uniref:Uncharacterized protein n=1 Tax=Paracoccidioides lutzii (strain ATCC MYA-826 / Pb01) TaxID=502779 RepID=C1H2W8_PARBA|nr:hypothetical protein PAAG_05111 [Paracoccidioides lutzii Pb01]EEH34062.2 hypothetical protein PAAG_05111 [Paracoccidioides lutzii Pb01]
MTTGARRRGTERACLSPTSPPCAYTPEVLVWTSRTSRPPDPSNIFNIPIQKENPVKVATRIKARSES